MQISLGAGVYIDVLSQAQVLHALVAAPGEHVAFVGAGVSKEAGVPLANEISDQIRVLLLANSMVPDPDEWARRELNWDDPRSRYRTCLELYGPAEDRVSYFRTLVKDRHPAFAHHALAMLMTEGLLHNTALTTNFDKLLEYAFIEQGAKECQAIRGSEEIEFWGQERDRNYVFKLHGDYDTHNILNTRVETRSIAPYFIDSSATLLYGRGLLVLGSAGNEESVFEFFKKILGSANWRVLSRGVRWGVYVGDTMPASISDEDSAELVKKALRRGGVNQDMVELLADQNNHLKDRRPCAMFPVWGTGNFFQSLVNAFARPSLRNRAQLFLDHRMRLRSTFGLQGLSQEAIEGHLNRLDTRRRDIETAAGRDEMPKSAVEALSPDGNTDIRVVYGDISSLSMMADAEFQDRVRAVVSPDDTSISAGGGVAYTLLTKAGSRSMLNELAKFAPIEHGTSIVTSGGDLPVQYIFHAAALKIEAPNGHYAVDRDSIRKTVVDVLDKADALRVTTLWIPLLGAGVGAVFPTDSFDAIIEALVDTTRTRLPRSVVVVVFEEGVLNRDHAAEILRRRLPPDAVRIHRPL